MKMLLTYYTPAAGFIHFFCIKAYKPSLSFSVI